MFHCIKPLGKTIRNLDLKKAESLSRGGWDDEGVDEDEVHRHPREEPEGQSSRGYRQVTLLVVLVMKGFNHCYG